MTGTVGNTVGNTGNTAEKPPPAAPRGHAGEPWTVAFRREREESWRELDRFVTLAERKGMRALGHEALARLPVLYRATLSSLGVARVSCLDRGLLEHLESLAARAYLCVYGPKQRLRGALAEYVAVRFPAAVRAAAPQLALAAASLAIGAVVAFVLCTRDFDLYWHFVAEGSAQGRDPTATVADLRKTLFGGDEEGSGPLAAFAAFLFSHNSRVSLLAFGLAIVGGVPALLLLLVTGFQLGAMSALFHDRGLGVEWWSWILPHGITELFAVVVATAAGLRLADALVFPGRSSRLRALAARGREAGVLAFGAIAMLLFAGLIEGFFRQAIDDVGTRYALAATTAAGWILYLCPPWRRAR